jgi:zinc/manganese transport system permease protein
MFLYDYFLEPFISFAFLQRALVACVTLALGCGPVGVLLVLRRMSLMGDALSHAVLPGAAIGFLISGLSLISMSIGGFCAGLTVALLAGAISQRTILKEDATFAGFFLLSIAIGSLLVSSSGSNVDLMHFLFGSVLAVNNESLMVVASITSFTLVLLSLIYRALIVECFDSHFLRSVGARGGVYHLLFLILVVLNLVSAFQALGTLMALGLMMLPAISARLWARNIGVLMILAIAIAIVSSYIGLLLSFFKDWPSGPCIIVVAGGFYIISLLFGSEQGLLRNGSSVCK